jgi:hypothetical protein
MRPDKLDLDLNSHMAIGTMAQESAESMPVDEQSEPTDMDPEEIEDEELEEIRCVRMVLRWLRTTDLSFLSRYEDFTTIGIPVPSCRIQVPDTLLCCFIDCIDWIQDSFRERKRRLRHARKTAYFSSYSGRHGLLKRLWTQFRKPLLNGESWFVLLLVGESK